MDVYVAACNLHGWQNIGDRMRLTRDGLNKVESSNEAKAIVQIIGSP